MRPTSFISNSLARSSLQNLTIFSSPVKIKSSTYKNNKKFTFYQDMIEVCIRFNFGEAQTGERVINPGVPSTRCLLETVQCSLESAYMLISIKGLKSFMLFNVHLLLDKSIEECCLHIHLVDLPPHQLPLPVRSLWPQIWPCTSRYMALYMFHFVYPSGTNH